MPSSKDAAIAAEVLALERAALDRWGNGDPDGYAEISAPDVTYFDPFQERRLNGLPELNALYDQFRGKIKILRDEIVDPRVQIVGDAAILTFTYVSQGSEGSMSWNCTEVYARTHAKWKILHTHWSFTNAAKGS